eukprot:109261_1
MGSLCGSADRSVSNIKTHVENEVDFKRLMTPKEKVLKVVLLGPSDSGKTTIIKQLQKIHETYDDANSQNVVAEIRDGIIENMKVLCEQSIVLNDDYNEESSVHRSVEYLRDEILALETPYHLGRDNVYKIKQLWHDEGIQHTLRKSNYFQIPDNAVYFMNKIDEVAADSYEASFEDYVQFHRRSTGYTPHKFTSYVDGYGEYVFEIPDVGGTRSERRKWWNQRVISDDVSAIVFVVPLSDYDKVLYEDDRTNRLVDAISLFTKTMIKGKFFQKQSVIVLFNKYDLFEEKIKKIPITHAFPTFPNAINANNADDVMKFVAGQFVSVFNDNGITMTNPLRILRTCAVDTESIEGVFGKIGPQIVKQNLVSFDVGSDDERVI